jgi:hypothetical protein
LSVSATNPDGGFALETHSPGVYDILVGARTTGADPQFGSIRVNVGTSNLENVSIPLRVGIHVRAKLAAVNQLACVTPVKVTFSPLPFRGGYRQLSALLRVNEESDLVDLAFTRYRVVAESSVGPSGTICINRSPYWIDTRTGEPNVDFEMAPLGSVRGQVEVLDRVTSYVAILIPHNAINDERRRVLVQRLSDTGRFSFENLADGNYYVILKRLTNSTVKWSPTRDSGDQTVRVRAGDITEVVVHRNGAKEN